MNAKLIIYRKEKIQNYEPLKQLCLLMNIEIILLNEQMTQNKVKDILNKKIKKTKKNNLEPAVVVFSNVVSLQMDQILSKLKNNSTLCRIIIRRKRNNFRSFYGKWNNWCCIKKIK